MSILREIRNVIRDHDGELLEMADQLDGLTYDHKAIFDDADQMSLAAERLEDIGVTSLAMDIVDGQCTMFLNIR